MAALLLSIIPEAALARANDTEPPLEGDLDTLANMYTDSVAQMDSAIETTRAYLLPRIVSLIFEVSRKSLTSQAGPSGILIIFKMASDILEIDPKCLQQTTLHSWMASVMEALPNVGATLDNPHLRSLHLSSSMP